MRDALTPPAEATPSAGRPARAPVNLRSVAMGLVGVCIICGLSAYNNYVLNNSLLVGNSLPLGVLVMTFALVVFINGPLNRFAPRWALSSGELSVALGMTLVSCCLPGAGLMRYWPSSLISPIWQAQSNPEFFHIFEVLDLPRWLFPTFHSAKPIEWGSEPLITGFIGRWIQPGPYPFLAWLTPLCTWAIFLAALYASFIFLLSIVHRQWYENERLAFPLAALQAALIEQPQRGRWLNNTMGDRGFKLGFALALSIHLWNGLAMYLPQNIPAIPLAYNFRATFSDGPASYIDPSVLAATIYLSVIGVAYFLSSQVACGLWLMYLLCNVFLKICWGVTGGDTDYPARYDQHFGAILAMFAAVVWIGRRHWVLVLKQMFRGRCEGEPAGRLLSFRTAAWGFVASLTVMTGWLIAAGCNLPAAVITVGMLMILMSVITRIVAETGLPYSGLQVPLTRPWSILASAASPHPIPVKSFYLASLVDAQHYDLREVAPVYITHAVKIADLSESDAPAGGTQSESTASRNFGVKFLAVMVLALIVGYIVSASATLWTEYHFASTLDRTNATPINSWGVVDEPRGFIVESVSRYAAPRPPPVQRNAMLHVALGFCFTAFLAVMRLSFAWWPLHPAGFVLLAPPAMSRMWFSIFLGWLAKAIIVRYGGAKFYTDGRPFFIGLIIGESVAAGVWLVVALLFSLKGWSYFPYIISPG